MRQHSPRLASRGAKLSRREKHWKRRVVEHSVLASTIVSLEFLDLSAISIRFGRFLVCGHRTPFLPIASWADLTKVRKASRAPESLEGTRGPVPSFLVHMESEGVRVRLFSRTRDLLDRRAQPSLDSSYVDCVGVAESTQSVS